VGGPGKQTSSTSLEGKQKKCEESTGLGGGKRGEKAGPIRRKRKNEPSTQSTSTLEEEKRMVIREN